MGFLVPVLTLNYALISSTENCKADKKEKKTIEKFYNTNRIHPQAQER